MPTVSVALFCFCVGSEPFDLKMAFYNPDNTSTPIKLSDLFLDEIDKQTINLVSYSKFLLRTLEVWIVFLFTEILRLESVGNQISKR